MLRRMTVLLLALIAFFPTGASAKHRSTSRDTHAALVFVDQVFLYVDRVAANQGNCHAIEKLFARVDPANVATWMGIVWHESSRAMWDSCGVGVAQLSGGPGRGLTQQTIGWNDGAGGRVTRYWHGLYYELGLDPNVHWRDAYSHIRVSVLHRNRYGWSAWNGAVGHRAPPKP